MAADAPCLQLCPVVFLHRSFFDCLNFLILDDLGLFVSWGPDQGFDVFYSPLCRKKRLLHSQWKPRMLFIWCEARVPTLRHSRSDFVVPSSRWGVDACLESQENTCASTCCGLFIFYVPRSKIRHIFTTTNFCSALNCYSFSANISSTWFEVLWIWNLFPLQLGRPIAEANLVQWKSPKSSWCCAGVQSWCSNRWCLLLDFGGASEDSLDLYRIEGMPSKQGAEEEASNGSSKERIREKVTIQRNSSLISLHLSA